MFKKILLVSLLSFFLLTPVLAQELTVVEPPAEPANYELEGIEVDNIIEAPSAWGLWWRGVRENVSLAFTFDPVKKAERSLKYAEERMQIAEQFSDLGETIKNQEKVQKNIVKAQQFMEKVELKKEAWLGDENQEKVNNLVKNIASHQIRKEAVFDKLEEKFSTIELTVNQEEKLEKIIDLRDKGLESSQRLMNAIDNINIPAIIREHLEDVKERIEAHSLEINTYQEAKEQLKAKIKQGVEGIQEDLNSLNEERKEQIKIHLENAKNLIPSMNRIMEKNNIESAVHEQERNAVQNRVNNQSLEVNQEKSREMNQNTIQVQKECLNFPGPDFCPNGIEEIIITGVDENGCNIYDCNSNSSNQINSGKLEASVQGNQQGQ